MTGMLRNVPALGIGEIRLPRSCIPEGRTSKFLHDGVKTAVQGCCGGHAENDYDDVHWNRNSVKIQEEGLGGTQWLVYPAWQCTLLSPATYRDTNRRNTWELASHTWMPRTWWLWVGNRERDCRCQSFLSNLYPLGQYSTFPWKDHNIHGSQKDLVPEDHDSEESQPNRHHPCRHVAVIDYGQSWPLESLTACLRWLVDSVSPLGSSAPESSHSHSEHADEQYGQDAEVKYRRWWGI